MFTANAHANSRIVGGTDAAPDAYPWMVAIIDAYSEDTYAAQFCGGSLVASGWVMTAAHCVFETPPSSIQVVVGATRLGGKGGERIFVDEIIVHPAYGYGSSVPDIALLRLRRDSTRSPVDLVSPGSNLAKPGDLATVIGWGATEEFGFNTPLLQEVDVPIVSHKVCSNAYDDDINAVADICAGYTAGGRDACQGDSGGPLFVQGGQGNRYRQAGVVSRGLGCARPGFPGVYTRVSTMFDWINYILGNDGDGGPIFGSFSADFSWRCKGLTCHFNGSLSTPGSLPIESYAWNFNDGSHDTGRGVTRTFAAGGHYEVTLVISDGFAGIDGATRTINVTDPVEGSNDYFTTYTLRGAVKEEQRRRLPSRHGVWVNDGPMKLVLGHHPGNNFDLALQKRNNVSNRWETINYSSRTRRREILTETDLQPGYYRFVILGVSGKGKFRLHIRHK